MRSYSNLRLVFWFLESDAIDPGKQSQSRIMVDRAGLVDRSFALVKRRTCWRDGDIVGYGR